MFSNSEYGSYENAAPVQDGLAAISVLLKASQIYLSSK